MCSGVSELDRMIERCEAAMRPGFDRDQAKELCYMVAGAYSAEIPGFQDYLWVPGFDSPDPEKNLPFIVAKLKAHRDRIARELMLAEASRTSMVQKAEQTTSVNVSVTFEWVIEKIDAAAGLSEGDKDEAKRRAFDLKEAVKKGRSAFTKAAKTTFDWVLDKGIDKLPMLLNYMAEAARSLPPS